MRTVSPPSSMQQAASCSTALCQRHCSSRPMCLRQSAVGQGAREQPWALRPIRGNRGSFEMLLQRGGWMLGTTTLQTAAAVLCSGSLLCLKSFLDRVMAELRALVFPNQSWLFQRAVQKCCKWVCGMTCQKGKLLPSAGVPWALEYHLWCA